MTATKTHRPYDAKHVQIVDDGRVVTALWIPDAEHAKDPAYVLDHILDRSRFDGVEVIAEATRFFKREGAGFSGWVVRSGRDHTDSIPNKRTAMQTMRGMIREYFQRPAAAATTTNTEEPAMPTATTADFKSGQRIIVGNGTTQTVVKMADRIGNEPQRVEVESGLQWLASECEPIADGTTYCGACGEVYASTADLDAHQNATNHERFVVHQAGFNRFAVRDTRTGIDASVSTSRSGAKHIADCLTDGTMVLDQLGHAIPATAPTATTGTDSGTFGVFDQDGECVDGPYYHRSEAEEQAQAHRDDDEDGEYTVREMCPDHDGHANDDCTECYGD